MCYFIAANKLIIFVIIQKSAVIFAPNHHLTLESSLESIQWDNSGKHP